MTAPARLVLASASRARIRLLADAGLEFEAVAADLDEHDIRDSLAARGVVAPTDVAVHLAQQKALFIAQTHRDALVIGADQVLVVDDEILAKPQGRDEARAQLMRLRGRSHQLISAVCCAAGHGILWSAASKATLTMREFSTGFLEHYLAAMGERVTSTVGAYEIEGPGVQLFSAIEGDLFTIQGLPLLDLVAHLRSVGVLET